ncbi:hypothetical protein L0F63_005110 [Massospora cicadina]|nr:hypothetical protein L0F63_005110 [Massospora cicadina]
MVEIKDNRCSVCKGEQRQNGLAHLIYRPHPPERRVSFNLIPITKYLEPEDQIHPHERRILNTNDRAATIREFRLANLDLFEEIYKALGSGSTRFFAILDLPRDLMDDDTFICEMHHFLSGFPTLYDRFKLGVGYSQLPNFPHSTEPITQKDIHTFRKLACRDKRFFRLTHLELFQAIRLSFSSCPSQWKTFNSIFFKSNEQVNDHDWATQIQLLLSTHPHLLAQLASIIDIELNDYNSSLQ